MGSERDAKREQAREVADFKLDQVADTLEGVKAYTGSYWTGEVEWNTELRIAWANDTSYCVELRDEHGSTTAARGDPGPRATGSCPAF